jgi:hypothetical protein
LDAGVAVEFPYAASAANENTLLVAIENSSF